MSPSTRQSCLVAAGVAGAVGVGYLTGRSLSVTECSYVAVTAGLVGAVLALAALFRWPTDEERWSIEQIGGVGLLGYTVLLALTGRFAHVGRWLDLVIEAGWLIPMLLGSLALPLRGCWVAGLGCWTVLFGSVVALTYSASHSDSGLGLLLVWRS